MRALLIAVLVALPNDRVPDDKFAELHTLIKPTAAEFAWYDQVPWLMSVQEAREKAAAQGKPLLIWCSADGQPCGAT